MNSFLKWIWLAEKCGPGSSEVLRLVEKIGSIDDIFAADYDRYSDAGLSERLCEDLCDKDTARAQKIINYCQLAKVGILTYESNNYPTSLRSLKNPPAVLYYAGELPDFNKKLCISIVGTRKMSEYGMRAAYKIAYEVASSGAIVVSGMALGIDGIASCAAIAAKGKTVAVLGCGIDIVYPKEHKKLKEIIKQNGAVLTEYPPATEPRGSNFPVRNRIISGLSQGTVVVDADLNSGSMITAKNAILQGRDVYAVPANIDSENSSGTNSLIRDGAQAVLCGHDIIRNYMFIYREVLNVQKMASSERYSEFDPNAVRNMGIAVRVMPAERKKNELDGIAHSERGKREAKASDEAKLSSEASISRPENDKKAEKTDVHPESGFNAPPQKSGGDDSAKILEKLSEKQRRIFDEMPLDRAVTVDYLTKTGFALGEVISALTILEIKGLVASLPGALYIRK
jgi:DNA processing protein